MKIRTLRSEDYLQFIALLNYLSSTELTFDEFSNILIKREMTKDLITFVAEEEVTLVGTASVFLERKFAHGGAHCLHIEDVVTHPDYRGRGVAKALIKHILNIPIDSYKAVLNCSRENVEFYKKCGFEEYDIGMRFNK